MRCIDRVARVALGVALGASLAACSDERPVANAGATLSFDQRDPTSRALRARGLQLRAAIDRFYVEHRTSATAKPTGTGLQHLVEEFLPIGTPFDGAEQILRYAGFTLAAVHDHYPRKYASITPYVKTFPWTDLGIAIYPTGNLDHAADPAGADWTMVRGVSAGFNVTWP